jgi:8-amino-7-oxononanoate synthase
MSAVDWLEDELSQLKSRGLLRDPGSARSSGLVDVCSNDYLGYALEAVSRETSVLERAGAGASRLVSGSFPIHEELEGALAQWLGHEAALLFSSGYMANLSTISALVGPGDAVFSDRLNHASIVDGCRLSGARVYVYPHLQLGRLREQLAEARGFRRLLVVSESYFSMDGDGPQLQELAEICRESAAMLMLDEAHALGIFGARGSGRAQEAGCTPDILVGTFGKALGAHGAFVAGSVSLRTWLWNRARGFVFSTGTSPSFAALLLQRVRRIQRDDAGRATLLAQCAPFAQELAGRGVALPMSQFGPIFPIILGSSERALRAAGRLREAGFYSPAIRPPTVPEGSARLRITLTTTLDDVTRGHLARELGAACA